MANEYRKAYQRAYQREWRKRHPGASKVASDAYNETRRALIVRAKSRACMDCKRRYPPYVMDLDHRPNEAKLFDMSRATSKGHAAIIAEIAKCDVVCSNCHRERTHERAAGNVH